jgi:hypothetical protein
MEKTFASARLAGDLGARSLISFLDGVEHDMGIDTGTLYYDFPLFRDSNERLHRAGVLLASRSHGIDLFSIVTPNNPEAVRASDEDLSQLQSIIFGKCLQSKLLRRSQRELIFPVEGFLIATGAETPRTRARSLRCPTLRWSRREACCPFRPWRSAVR